MSEPHNSNCGVNRGRDCTCEVRAHPQDYPQRQQRVERGGPVTEAGKALVKLIGNIRERNNLPRFDDVYADSVVRIEKEAAAVERAKWTSRHVHDLSLRDHAQELVNRWRHGIVTRSEAEIISALEADLAALREAQ